MAYNGFTKRVVINYSLTRKISVRPSVRQGCPLSPLLFALDLEPVCFNIIRSERLRGVCKGDVKTKVLGYADDIAVFSFHKKKKCHKRLSIA